MDKSSPLSPSPLRDMLETPSNLCVKMLLILVNKNGIMRQIKCINIPPQEFLTYIYLRPAQISPHVLIPEPLVLVLILRYLDSTSGLPKHPDSLPILCFSAYPVQQEKSKSRYYT